MLKIKGLVRVFNRVRSQLQPGLQPGEVELFRKQVSTTVRDDERRFAEYTNAERLLKELALKQRGWAS